MTTRPERLSRETKAFLDTPLFRGSVARNSSKSLLAKTGFAAKNSSSVMLKDSLPKGAAQKSVWTLQAEVKFSSSGQKKAQDEIVRLGPSDFSDQLLFNSFSVAGATGNDDASPMSLPWKNFGCAFLEILK
jgi:hypothetical protein